MPRAKIDFQDDVDNIIFDFMNTVLDIYGQKEIEWNIGKISEIRFSLEKVLDLPNIY